MSNILIIKHGAFGDIIQALGTIQDIANFHGGKVDILTHKSYVKLFKQLPWVDGIVVDDRQQKYISLISHLRRQLKQNSHQIVYDLQNSTRSTLYRWLFFRHIPFISNRSMLLLHETKKALDKKNIFHSFSKMLTRQNIPIEHCYEPKVSYLADNSYKEHLTNKPYVFLAPYCSASNPQKKWPHFHALVEQLNIDFPELTFVTAPGPDEINESKTYAAKVLFDRDNPTSLTQLIKIIIDASFVITIDTAAAHIASHANKPGVLLMDCERFKRIFLEKKQFVLGSNHTQMSDLKLNQVYPLIKDKLESCLNILALDVN